MSELIADAGRMAALFRGFSGGYGTYDVRLLGKAKGKQKVHQFMVKKTADNRFVQGTFIRSNACWYLFVGR